MNAVVSILIWGALIWGGFAWFGGDDESTYDYVPTSSYSDDSSYYDDYSYYGDSYSGYDEPDYPAGFSGTDTMEACNNDTGSCYDLDIDSDGENIERINFPNGGWRDVDYSECEDGYCYVEDEDGTEWELQY